MTEYLPVSFNMSDRSDNEGSGEVIKDHRGKVIRKYIVPSQCASTMCVNVR